MNNFIYLAPWIIAATITGCSIVYTTQPIGDEPHRIEAVAWEGNWTNGEK